MTERLVSKLHVALLSYDEREIRVRKNYLEEQNPAICCVCFHSGEELLRELRQQRSVDIVVLSSQLEDMGQESIRLERTLREMMGLLEVEMNDKPPMKPVDLCWILMEAAQIAPEIEKQLDIRLIVDHSPFRRCYVKADAQEAEQLLFHLLSNALRAVSPGGQIKIRLTRDDEDLYLIVEDDGCGLPTGENWMENRRRFLGGVQAGLLLCRRYCAHMGWVLSLTPRDAGSGTRAEVRIPLAGTMFPIEGSVELHTIHPALTTADGLRWQILRELALLSDKME